MGKKSKLQDMQGYENDQLVPIRIRQVQGLRLSCAFGPAGMSMSGCREAETHETSNVGNLATTR